MVARALFFFLARCEDGAGRGEGEIRFHRYDSRHVVSNHPDQRLERVDGKQFVYSNRIKIGGIKGQDLNKSTVQCPVLCKQRLAV
jgi:hypothetical protein